MTSLHSELQGRPAIIKLIMSAFLLSGKTSIILSHNGWKHNWTGKTGYALNCVGLSTISNKYS